MYVVFGRFGVACWVCVCVCVALGGSVGDTCSGLRRWSGRHMYMYVVASVPINWVG